MTKLLIHNARCVNPDNDYDQMGGILIGDGLIQTLFVGEADNVLRSQADDIIDAGGMVLTAGLCDICVGVGDGGGKHRESFATLSKAALSGGITSVLIDPDMSPALDMPATCDYALRRAKSDGDIKISVAAGLTKGLEGQEISQIALLKEIGVTCFTDGDKTIFNSLVLKRAMDYAKHHNVIVMTYPDDRFLSAHGVAHEGFVSSLYGLPTIPDIAEIIGLERDIRLAEATGCKLHIRQISSAKSLSIIERAKKAGLDISVSVSAQHISLNEYDIIPYKSFLKMRPPLRTEEDRVALQEAVISGLIDIVSSVHRPRHIDSKRLPFEEADIGCSSIETLLSVMLALYHNRKMSLAEALKPVTSNPAKRFGLSGGRLDIGSPADVILIDIEQGYRIQKEKMYSDSKNTPFEGHLFQGLCQKAFVDGKLVF